MEILAWLVSFFLQWYVWVPLVILLSYLTWRNYQKIDNDSPNVDSVLLVLEIPRANDKSELAAEQLFASLHGILRDKKELRLSGGKQEHLSFEIASVSGQIRFYVWVPRTLQSFVEGQIYSQYPSVQIYPANEDYTEAVKHVTTEPGVDLAKDVKNVPGKVGDYVKLLKSFKVYPVVELRLTRRIWVK